MSSEESVDLKYAKGSTGMTLSLIILRDEEDLIVGFSAVGGHHRAQDSHAQA